MFLCNKIPKENKKKTAGAFDPKDERIHALESSTVANTSEQKRSILNACITFSRKLKPVIALVITGLLDTGITTEQSKTCLKFLILSF